MMSTKFKVGDKVRIINALGSIHENGDIGVITELDYEMFCVSVNGIEQYHYAEDIEHVNANSTHEKRIKALETEVSELKAEIEAIKQLQPKKTVPTPTPNEQRKAIIAEAREFVAHTTAKMNDGRDNTEGNATYRYFMTVPEFHVNPEKRVVTALVKGAASGKLLEKAITKCAPTDVFNADIGKAIALGRALGLDVSKFEQAVQPTEVEVGQKVRGANGICDGEVCVIKPRGVYFDKYAAVDSPFAKNGVIIDDTEAQYE